MHERPNRRIWITKLMRAPIMAVCLLSSLCMPLFAHGDDQESPLGDIFPRDEVLQIDITVDQDDWDEIRKQTRSFAEALGPSRQFETVESPFSYVTADVTINFQRNQPQQRSSATYLASDAPASSPTVSAVR